MIALGIDPGSEVIGFGCLRVDPGAGGMPELIEAGLIRLGRGALAVRLAELERDLVGLMDRLGPEVVCVEALFAHFAHPRTAVIMAHARGVILLVCQRAGARLIEVPPAEVKKAVAGYGRASKSQMRSAIMAGLGLSGLPPPADAADALAAAICGVRRIKPIPIMPSDGRARVFSWSADAGGSRSIR